MFFAPAQSDGTYTTQSELRFRASRHENGETLTCEASNAVLQQQNERPLRDTVTLEVLCEYTLVTVDVVDGDL